MGGWTYADINKMAVLDGKFYKTLNNCFSSRNSVFVPDGRHTHSAQLGLTANYSYTIIGVGSVPFIDGRQWYTNSEYGISTIYLSASTDLTHYLYFASLPSSGYSNYLKVHGIDFRTGRQMYDSTSAFIECNYNYHTVLNDVSVAPDTMSVAAPIKGEAIYVGNAYTCLMDGVYVSGFGGPSASSKAKGQIEINSDPLIVSMNNIFLNGMNHNVHGLYIKDTSPMESIRNVYFENFGSSTNTELPIYLLYVYGIFGEATSEIQVDGMTVYDWNPYTDQSASIYIDDPNVFVTIKRAIELGTAPAGRAKVFRATGTGWMNLRLEGESHLDGTGSGWGNIGFQAYPFDTSINAISPSTVGTSASAPVASTDYYVEMRNVMLYVNGGTAVTISIAGTTVSYNTSGQSFYVPVGRKINFGGFSAAPTISALFM